MSEVKIINVSHAIELSINENESSVFKSAEDELNALVKDGWKIVGVIPQRSYSSAGVVGCKGWLIEFLRKIPVISFFINLIWPLVLVAGENSFTGVILQKD